METFTLLGPVIRTTNQNGQAAHDIPALWQRFFAENLAAAIPGRVDNAIYCLYTDYETDHTGPYTTLLGCRVEAGTPAPAGMETRAVPAGQYHEIVAKGNLDSGLIYDAWVTIWQSDLPRAFTADFEVYGERAADPADAEVSIFVAVR
ncbi:MAG: AraC family transcriptional regulator [Siphonobacter aquaeclarae]|nr:AraC family transcriptional regulator [Siphonobacter aquaeclarae]